MKKHNNHISDERLSKYFDGEIPASDQKDIEKHLEECGYCSNRLARYRKLREISGKNPNPELKRDLWPSINSQINVLDDQKKSVKNYKQWAAIAVMLLIVLTGSWMLLGEPFGAMDEDPQTAETVNQYAFDYGLFLSGLQNSELMQQFNNGYKRQEVTLAGANDVSTSRPDTNLINSLPKSFSIESRYLLESACCQCNQYTVEHNGQQITIFQQPKKHPAEFTGYHQKHATIDSTDCSKIETDDYTALSFDSGDSKYVVVGKRQDPMLPEVMHRLQNGH